MGGKIRQEPRSGCRKIKTIGREKTIKTLEMALREWRKWVSLLLARTPLARIRVAIFAGSEGWSLKALKFSQRRAP